jgi:hypothetical protein
MFGWLKTKLTGARRLTTEPHQQALMDAQAALYDIVRARSGLCEDGEKLIKKAFRGPQRALRSIGLDDVAEELLVRKLEALTTEPALVRARSLSSSLSTGYLSREEALALILDLENLAEQVDRHFFSSLTVEWPALLPV